METLAERIARDGPVSELDAIGWAIRLAKRLEALHALGVAHGSVSPACILAAGQDRNARAYLADLQRTTPSPAYQSPERILGGDISTADDVWALATTLYALLTGQSPYAGGSDAELRQKILAASPPPLRVYDVGDDDLQHILDHAFAREIGQRTAGIGAFRRALEEWHPDRGVANLPPLEDEDAADDDGGRTMYVQPAAGGPVSKVEQDDDDEDNARTMMRAVPRDDLAAIFARADAKAAARVPAPAMMGAPALLAEPFAPEFGGRPAPPPQIVDDDSGEEDVRTRMRTPEQRQRVDEDSEDDAPRTLLLREKQDPWQPPPAGRAPPGRSAAAWGDGGGGLGGPSPAATLALPSYFEPPSPEYAAPGHLEPRPQSPDPVVHPFGEPYLSGPQGTQKIPPSFAYDPRSQSPALTTLPLDMPSIALESAVGGPYPGGVQQPYGTGSAPRSPQSPGPAALAPGPRKSSKNGLILAAVVALLLAAVATFALLELKGI